MLLKNTLKKVKKSLGRYLSLLIIIFLGVGFYTGITESIPNIQETQIKYYEDTNLADIRILSTFGFNEDDVAEINTLTGIEDAIATYSKDVLVGENVIRMHAIEKKVNDVYLVDGKMPTEENECLADADHYKVGDKITINEESKENLKVTEYEVVGTIYSPIYTSNEFGTTDIGNGKLYSFIFVPKDNFDFEYFTEVYLTVDKTKNDIPYSEGYNIKVDKITEQLEEIKTIRINARINEIYHASNGTISKNSLRNNTWYVMDRDEFVPTYTILESQYDQVITIANVIPIFFILIVALMTSNTMTRMITEERSEMGTLLSLGFGDETITNNYLIYVLSATIVGAVLGYFIGTITLPQLVYSCFPINFPPIAYSFNWPLFLMALSVSCLLMAIVTTTACDKVLKQQPAYLLRPEPPKSGKKVLLEKVHFIWNRLSFSSKITIRNIARYKKRVIITLIGAAGCTFMIMIGLGLKDSINTVGDKQYGDLTKYDNLMILNNNIKEIDETLKNQLDGLVKDELLLNQSTYKVIDSENSLDIYLITPEKTSDLFYKYFVLKAENSSKKIKLKTAGVVITPKIAERFNVKKGDTITIESSSKKKYDLKVTDITENYVSNYIYMSKEYYEKVFEEEATYNVIVSTNIKNKDKIATKLLEEKAVLSINFREDLLKTANEAVQGLNNIVILLVVISSVLAFTVLYNLTSINISERIREIATLKVLGFTDRESNEYIYRETMVTVIIGIIIGLLITPPLHGMIMKLLEVDHMIFLKNINVLSYVFASVLTLLFAIIMQIITYYKLKKVNMIESLKSVE